MLVQNLNTRLGISLVGLLLAAVGCGKQHDNTKAKEVHDSGTSADSESTGGANNSTTVDGGESDKPRSYSGTAAVGDFLTVEIDPTAMTLSYDNKTNGNSGTVSYTLAKDGSLDVQDPDGNVLHAIELPGYAIVLDLDHAGPSQDTRSFAFGILQAPISAKTFSLGKGVVMQFRTSSGGMEVGCVQQNSDGTVDIESYWPFGALNDQGAAFHISQQAPINLVDDPSGYFVTLMDPNGDPPATLFATPSGISAIDNPNGNMIIFEQPATAGFDQNWAGDYTALLYDKSDAGRGGTASDGGTLAEEGTPSIDSYAIHLSSSGEVTLQDASGSNMLTGTLAPSSDVLVGAGMFTTPCNGLFTFSFLDQGQSRDVFMAFVDRVLLIASFRPNGDGSYGYFYGAGLRAD